MSAPSPYWADDRVTLHLGDCLDILPSLEAGSVDAVVTDPPYGLEFMGKAFDRFDGNGVDPAFCHWFAGFTDGEGCFSVHKKHVNGCETYDCQFSITLRADDKPILQRIQRELGIGTIADRPRHDGNAKTQARYCVSSQRECIILRDIFRAFPLRAKKATDFELWSEALDEWLTHERGQWDGMANARDRLMANREFKPEGIRVNPYQMWCWRWARECLRVLKPGGYMLAFGGTRTWHRLACAVEDAGFEIRDSTADLTGQDAPGLMWLYGSGFPKSLDVSKSIDKSKRRGYVAAAVRLGMEIPGRNLDDWTKEDHSPGDRWWAEFRKHLSAEQWAAIEREVVACGQSSAASIAYARAAAGAYDITAPATEDAARWEGWGTALKPAWEPIVVARKPPAGNVAANVLAYGTGAFNIDACRVEPTGESRPRNGEASQETRYTDSGGTDFAALPGVRGGDPAGRWPPNVVLGTQAAAELDRQSGVLTSGANPTRRSSDVFSRDVYGDFAGQRQCVAHRGADSGGASRFFPVFKYEPKAGSDERPRGDDGSGHPTVKPLDLVRWKVRLVTPPGGLVLDLFAGSGTTGEACIIEGFRCVLIEKDPASVGLIRTRLRKPIQPDIFGGVA